MKELLFIYALTLATAITTRAGWFDTLRSPESFLSEDIPQSAIRSL